MSEPGYIDYARVNLASGFLLAGGQQAFIELTQVFQGYVGSWPYINFFWSAISGPGHCSIILNYYSDHTFTTIVATQISTRNTACTSARQFPVVTPWVIIEVNPDSATDTTIVGYAFYGATQPASAVKLGKLDGAYIEFTGSVAAGGTITDIPIIIYPGRISASWYAGLAVSQFSLQRWDFGTKAWITFWLANINTANTTDKAIIAVPDAPIQVTMHNGGASAAELEFLATAIMD